MSLTLSYNPGHMADLTELHHTGKSVRNYSLMNTVDSILDKISFVKCFFHYILKYHAYHSLKGLNLRLPFPIKLYCTFG